VARVSGPACADARNLLWQGPRVTIAFAPSITAQTVR
jgi:hypothetical protein